MSADADIDTDFVNGSTRRRHLLGGLVGSCVVAPVVGLVSVGFAALAVHAGGIHNDFKYLLAVVISLPVSVVAFLLIRARVDRHWQIGIGLGLFVVVAVACVIAVLFLAIAVALLGFAFSQASAI